MVIVLSISKLNKLHNRQAFDCGIEPLNRFIRQLASQMIKRDEVAIYVAHQDNQVFGFYTLSACEITQSDDPNYLKKQSPHTPIPCVLLGRLAVDKSMQGKGLGADLLRNALSRCKQLAQILGVAFVVVDAKDENAKSFYEYYGFVALQNNPMRLCFAIREIPEIKE